MNLSALFDIEQLRQEIADGYVKASFHDDDSRLMILNYTHKCQNEGHWSDVTRQTRGLIVQTTPFGLDGTVISKPFGKFFNLGEHPEGTFDLSERVLAVDKMDGSLGILYPHPKGGYAIATRGSFHSEQAAKATEMLQDAICKGFTPRDEFTYLFEILYPENRIVVNYGDFEGLILLYSRGPDGYVMDFLAEDYFGTPRSYLATLGEVIKDVHRENKEGYVVHFVDRKGPVWETSVKVKQEDYLALHRVVTGLNELTVWDAIRNTDEFEELRSKLPEEFLPWLDRTANAINFEMWSIREDAHDLYSDVLFDAFPDGVKGDDERANRKAFAQAVHGLGTRLEPLLFLLYDDKIEQFREAVWKMARPTMTNNRVKALEEAA